MLTVVGENSIVTQAVIARCVMMVRVDQMAIVPVHVGAAVMKVNASINKIRKFQEFI